VLLSLGSASTSMPDVPLIRSSRAGLKSRTGMCRYRVLEARTPDWVVVRMYEVTNAADEPELSVGTRVEVRDRFCAAWNSGFEVVAATRHWCRVRRLSDSYVLPVDFDVIDLRPVEVC
jgi:hypothetical protein